MPKRRDRKNRVLRKGEVQRDDGRYQYRYIGSAKPKPTTTLMTRVERLR
ncbi:MAG: integrase DNA-binding domain-containing protein [Ruminococcus sp.]|nr:integrase DNA-binding domain-containing protein [Ruminococcus sp.]